MRSYFAMSKLILPAIIIVAAGALIAIFIVGNQSDSVSKANAPLLGDKHADLGQKHIAAGVQHEAYNSNPPSSGSHYASPAPWGIKDSELPDETLIHNLEHGGIEIAYKPDLPQAQIDQLKKIVATFPASSKFNETKAVLVPRATNDHPIELAAWTYTLSLESVEQNKIIDFYNGHLDKGPELVP
jgi:hypothetical protein